MKLSVTQTRRGFTLIELVGVLAVIAILAALLVPKIFAAIDESRMNNVVASFNTAKAATMDYFAKYGCFAGRGGAALDPASQPDIAQHWDSQVLLPEGMIERPFGPRIGDDAWVRLVAAPATGAAVTGGDDGSYNFDGSGGSTPITQTGGAARVVECVISNVAVEDAREISTRIDGESLTELDPAVQSDYKGRVKYDAPAAGNRTMIHIYIAHK